MNPASEEIKDMLVSSSIGAGSFASTTGWSIHIGGIPDTVNVPNTCISITDTAGAGSEPNYVYQYPTIQILVRGNPGDYKDAYSKAEEIKDALHARTNELAATARYVQILCLGDIGFVARDDKKRPIFSINFAIQRTVATEIFEFVTDDVFEWEVDDDFEFVTD